MSESLNYLALTKSETKKTLLKVLEDPSYRANAAKASAKFRDQKEHPLDRAIWWIEWLLRNPDCDYLISPVQRLGFFVGNAYDIIVFVTLVVAGVVLAIIKLICLCTKRNASQRCVQKNHADKKKQQ